MKNLFFALFFIFSLSSFNTFNLGNNTTKSYLENENFGVCSVTITTHHNDPFSGPYTRTITYTSTVHEPGSEGCSNFQWTMLRLRLTLVAGL